MTTLNLKAVSKYFPPIFQSYYNLNSYLKTQISFSSMPNLISFWKSDHRFKCFHTEYKSSKRTTTSNYRICYDMYVIQKKKQKLIQLNVASVKILILVVEKNILLIKNRKQQIPHTSISIIMTFQKSITGLSGRENLTAVTTDWQIKTYLPHMLPHPRYLVPEVLTLYLHELLSPYSYHPYPILFISSLTIFLQSVVLPHSWPLSASSQ